ncbi:protein FAR-RED ELONGATED HYPOCOTYL 3-like [Juglans microcarpa x Juglans regia]|uniref:protein FAR-RED ELONGATED HYPOCOTYL 3-like n=1 Tax=Juglans microcarpa x Juglans regia TaxID=2249226 RepID=UPI001B7DF405|nr:protein FAR-RED ELONGATED HYPOCOTYL 3-like [Juglans microcarpa x Juglans regia]
MKFATDHELMAYYMRYVKQQGFGVITQRTQRTKREANGRVKYLTIGYARGGKYQPSHSNISRLHPTIKTDCKAQINAHLVEGSWVVTTVEIAHNHSTFQEKGCRNFIDKARQLRLGKGGGKALTEYFKRMRLQNDSFVYVIDVDEELRLRNVFWADARSKVAYEYFRDMITFDTTYLTNRYSMLFAPFVGVNHHGKEGCISTYDILDEITTDDDNVKSIKYTVYFNDKEVDVKCTCALFEMREIVCRHALNVCQMNKIYALPEKYLLDRWRKDLKRRYILVKSSYNDLRQNADSRMYEFVMKRCVKLATHVSSSDAHVTAFMRHLDEFENQFKGLTLESSSTKVTETVVTDKGKKILSPYVVRGKGRPPTKRKVPPVEKVATKRKKKQVIPFLQVFIT